MKIFAGALAVIAVMVMVGSAQDKAGVKTVNGGLLNGRAISLPKPQYPVGPRTAGIEGTVAVDILIDEGGNVVSAVANECDGGVPVPAVGECKKADGDLKLAAEQAALQARFEPTLLSGAPVRVNGRLMYHFAAAHGLINGGVLNGKATHLETPAYPPAARAVKASGAVSVRVTVDDNGNVVETEAVSGHPLLRAAAVEAASRSKFSPTLLSGVPTRITGLLVFNFVAD